MVTNHTNHVLANIEVTVDGQHLILLITIVFLKTILKFANNLLLLLLIYFIKIIFYILVHTRLSLMVLLFVDFLILTELLYMVADPSRFRLEVNASVGMPKRLMVQEISMHTSLIILDS